MLDDKTLKFIEKVAADDSVGASQLKNKKDYTHEKYPAAGAGAGAGLGLVMGHLAGGKYKSLKRIGGTALGALLGKKVGDLGSFRKNETYEGTIKRQDKVKDGKAQIPRLEASKQLES